MGQVDSRIARMLFGRLAREFGALISAADGSPSAFMIAL
jgi:hypothetical protein